MSTATVHHLPGAAKAERLRDLDEQAKALAVGDWVRVTYRNGDDGTSGVIEGRVRLESGLTNSLFVGRYFCLTLHTHVHVDVTAIETERQPLLDMDTLAERVALWCEAQLEFEHAPVGKSGTGDRTYEENQMLEAEDYVRTYLRGVAL